MSGFEMIAILSAAALGAVGALAVQLLQNKASAKTRLGERYFDAYTEVTEALVGLANAHNRNDSAGPETERYMLVKARFCLAAPDAVLKPFLEFDRIVSGREEFSLKEYDKRLAKFLSVARADLQTSTSIDESDLLSLTPFGRTLREESAK